MTKYVIRFNNFKQITANMIMAWSLWLLKKGPAKDTVNTCDTNRKLLFGYEKCFGWWREVNQFFGTITFLADHHSFPNPTPLPHSSLHYTLCNWFVCQSTTSSLSSRRQTNKPLVLQRLPNNLEEKVNRLQYSINLFDNIIGK